MYRAGCLIAALGMLAACGDNGGVPANTPTAPPAAPAGGAGKAAGGTPATTAGGQAATGLAGMGTSTMTGTAGMTAAAAGMTGAAGMAAGEAVPGCEAADKTVVGAAAYADAASVLTAQLPCGVSSCHGGMMPQLNLPLYESKDLKTLLVDKPSCEAPSLMLIDKSGGDVGLTKSWIWQKLTAPTNMAAGDTLIPQTAWGTPGTTCTSFMGPVMGFGIRMPLGTAKVLAESDLSKIRNWICAGAPGPM